MRELRALGHLVLDCAHDRGVADGPIVDKHSVDRSHGVHQSALLDLGNHLGVLSAFVSQLYVVVQNPSFIAVAPLEFGADDGCDLLRRPRGASTAGETVSGGGHVVHLDDDGFSHVDAPVS